MNAPVRTHNVRLQQLARRVHALGERPLYEMFRELLNGADPLSTVESYARLDDAVVRALGGAHFRPPCIVAGLEHEGAKNV